VFFDGVCGLCNRTVQFLLRHDRGDIFRFAPLQGATAQRILLPLGGRPDALETIHVVTADGKLLVRSRAVLFAATALGGGWKLLGLFWLVPRPLADLVYGFVARIRYRVFGRFDACALPTAAERAKFLDDQTAPMSIGR
jgi:predicted DCC family thiol-disulfide oxidoreductase YuxK